jgi:hypothetical protein
MIGADGAAAGAARAAAVSLPGAAFSHCSACNHIHDAYHE